MPPLEVDILNPFEVPSLGVRFLDGRSVSERSLALGMDGIRTNTFGHGPGAPLSPFGWELCDDSVRIRNEIERRWEEHAASDPAADRAAWVASGAAIVDEATNDPSSQNIRLIARDLVDRRIVGGIVLQNVEHLGTLSDGARSVSVFPLAGLPSLAGLSIPATWGALARYVLANDLDLVGGGRLSIDEIRLPTTPETGFEPTPENRLGDLWDVLDDTTDVVEQRADDPTPRVLRSRRRRLG